jgi:hypothetical protein
MASTELQFFGCVVGKFLQLQPHLFATSPAHPIAVRAFFRQTITVCKSMTNIFEKRVEIRQTLDLPEATHYKG